MIIFTGDFKILEDLGFVINESHEYYFLPRMGMYRYYNPISITIATREVESQDKKDLELIKNYIKEIV